MAIDPELIASITQNIFSNPDLTLEEEEITDQDFFALIDALKSNSHVKNLCLRNNNLSDDGMTYLAENFAALSLETLDVSLNEITEKGCVPLSKATLKKINISANPIRDGVSAFKDSTSLIELIAFQCQISDSGAEPLFLSHSIQKLDLGNNIISGECLKDIKGNDILKELSLLQNPILEKNCAYFSQNKTLIFLELTGTHLRDEAAEFLAQNKTLRSLSMDECFLTDKGAIAFSRNQTLEKLILANNQIGDAGAMSLIDNITLLHLNLAENPISFNIADKLKTQYDTEEDYLVFTRTSNYIEKFLKKNNTSESQLSSSSNSKPAILKSENEKSLAMPLLFTPQHLVESSISSLGENLARALAEKFFSIPQVSQFFETEQVCQFFEEADETQKKIFIETLIIKANFDPLSKKRKRPDSFDITSQGKL